MFRLDRKPFSQVLSTGCASGWNHTTNKISYPDEEEAEWEPSMGRS